MEYGSCGGGGSMMGCWYNWFESLNFYFFAIVLAGFCVVRRVRQLNWLLKQGTSLLKRGVGENGLRMVEMAGDCGDHGGDD